MSNENSRQKRRDREMRQRWMREGFKEARARAADVCMEIASRNDRRTAEEREGGRSASYLVRCFRSASHRLRSMSAPDTIIAALDASASDMPVLPCDVWLPPATLVKAGCPIDTLAAALTVPWRPTRFPAEGHLGRGVVEIISPDQPSIERCDGCGTQISDETGRRVWADDALTCTDCSPVKVEDPDAATGCADEQVFAIGGVPQ